MVDGYGAVGWTVMMLMYIIFGVYEVGCLTPSPSHKQTTYLGIFRSQTGLSMESDISNHF